MSKLLEYGFKSSEVAKINSYVGIINGVDKRNAISVNMALQAYGNLCQDLSNRIGGWNTISKVCNDVLGLACRECNWSGDMTPGILLVEIPDGRGRFCRLDMLFNPGFEWEWTEAGGLIRTTRLYGDKDILNYSADPLQYLKFKCMPDERLTCDIKQDASANDEYSGVAPVFLGVELEVERKKDTPKRIAHMVVGDLGMDYVILKSDGSLQDGFEIVTAPATIRYHLQAWNKFFDNSAKHLSSYASGRCGMHVHISRAALTPLHLGKMIAFINNNENRDLITSIAGRNSTYGKYTEDRPFHVKSKLVSYIDNLYKQLRNSNDKAVIANLEGQIASARAKLSKTTTGNVTGLLQDIERGGERHSALNLTKRGTVEVRIFRGNVSKIGMLKNLEFVHAMVEFTRDATFRTAVLNKEEEAERKLKRKENTDYALHYSYFLDWLDKDNTGNYNNIKQWLATHKWSDKYSKKKVSSKTPPDKRVTEDDVRACA